MKERKQGLNRKQLTLAIASILFSGSLAAQIGLNQRPDPIADFDTDGDGVISYAEFLDSPIASIERMDEDQNGVLTVDELMNARPGPGPRGPRGPRGGPGDRQPPADLSEEQIEQREARREQMQQRMQERAAQQFSIMDADGDEMVTAEEFSTATFANFDADGDGVLTAQELRPKRRGGPGGRGPGRRGGRPDQAAAN